jgi:DNA polymerase-1
MKRLIIDGNNLVHRTFWVAKNQPIYNEHFHIHLFLTSIKNYVNMFQPNVTYCAWDEKADYQVNKRKALLEGYKGNRDHERNKEVHTKNYIIKEMLSYLGINSVGPYAYEADDVIAIFCNEYKDDQKVIVTVDRDLCQLIDQNTVVYDPIRKVEFNLANFEEKLKCKKDRFVIVKALQGDKSDNVPGIKGFGKVKIEKYLAGEVEMTAEETAQFAHNLLLLDLRNTLQDKTECSYVTEQFQKPVEFKFDQFKNRCKELEFHQILKNIDQWYDTFFLRSDQIRTLTDFLKF